MRGKFALISLIVGFFLHLVDIFWDIAVAIIYFVRGEWWWGSLTFAFILLPVIILSVLKFVDGEPCQGKLRSLFALLFAVPKYFIDALGKWKKENWDIKPCTRDYWRCSCDQCKIYCERKIESAFFAADFPGFARILETLAESAPQCCLQIYIMLRQWYFPWYTQVSTIFSFLSLVWGVTVQLKAENTSEWYTIKKIRKNYPTAFVSYFIFFLWQLCGLLSRLSALVIFAYVFRYYVFVALGVHLLLFTMVVMVVAFVSELSCECFNPFKFDCSVFGVLFVLGFGILFSFSVPSMFHVWENMIIVMFQDEVEENRTRVIVPYHIALSLENVVLTLIAVFAAPAGTTHIEDLKLIVLLVVFLGMAFASVFLAAYLGCVHPSKFTNLAQREAENNTEQPDQSGTTNQGASV